MDEEASIDALKRTPRPFPKKILSPIHLETLSQIPSWVELDWQSRCYDEAWSAAEVGPSLKTLQSAPDDTTVACISPGWICSAM